VLGAIALFDRAEAFAAAWARERCAPAFDESPDYEAGQQVHSRPQDTGRQKRPSLAGYDSNFGGSAGRFFLLPPRAPRLPFSLYIPRGVVAN
jgi:hypothetical protein